MRNLKAGGLKMTEGFGFLDSVGLYGSLILSGMWDRFVGPGDAVYLLERITEDPDLNVYKDPEEKKAERQDYRTSM